MGSKFINIKNIDPLSLIKDVFRWFWIVIVAIGMGTMLMYTYISDNYQPQYTSSAIYVVTPRQSTGYVYTNRRFAESVITVFQNLLNADIMRTRIANEIHVSNIDATMSAELITETNLMKLTVSSSDPIVSFQLIEAIMDKYDELSEYLTSDAVFDELKAPIVATAPNEALAPQNDSIKTGLVCGVLAILGIMAFSIMRKTIKTEAAIDDQLETTHLGTIYHENKNKTLKSKVAQTVKALLITSPIMSAKFIESINNIRVKIEYECERNPRKNIFLVSSVCENEGKSTVALNVALSLAREGKKVIMVDADLRKPAIYKMLDIKKYEVVDMIKLLQGACGLDECLYNEEKLGLQIVMPTKGHSSTHEFTKSNAMKDLLDKCSHMADYVIVDTPPMSMVSDTEALLDYVDHCLLVIRQDFAYERDIINCVNIMEDSGANMLGCVLNDYKVFGVNRKRHSYGYGNTTSNGKAVEIYE